MNNQILCFAGSARKDSFNKKLALWASELLKKQGASYTFVDLKDFPMPLYDGDLEKDSGIPQKAREFKKLLISHWAFVIASPEYNSSVSPLLKNALDWASRPEPNEASLVAFQNKAALLLSTSPGALGGLRGLTEVRRILENIGVHVIPEQIAVPKAMEAFNPDGSLKDQKQSQLIDSALKKLNAFAKFLPTTVGPA